MKQEGILNGLDEMWRDHASSDSKVWGRAVRWPTAKPGNYLSLNLCAALEFVQASIQRARYIYMYIEEIGIVHT